jgi:large subunit ribosomal protein L17
MAYRKLGVDNKHRRSMLANLTKDLINNESIKTTETRAKEVRKSFDKMVTYAKEGSLVSRRKVLAFLQNDNVATKKVFELADRFANRNGGYTTMLKLSERRGDDALMVILKLVDEVKEEPAKETKKTKKEETKKEN